MAIAEYRGIVKTFKETIAVNNVSFDIGEGKIVGLLGPNGSGKTTLLKMTAGLLYQDEGELRVGGMPIGCETKKIVSYLPERTYLDETMTVEEIFKFFSDFYSDFDVNKARDMLDRLGINSKGRLKTFSKGTKEKVQLVLVMSRRAKLYLLDEPIAGVDPAAREYILNNIIREYNENSSVVISTHLISDVEPMLDDAVFIRYGKLLLSDSVENIKAEHNMSVDAYFRREFRC